MPIPPSNAHDIQAAIAVLIIAYLCVAYWRTTLRVILTVLIAVAIYGSVVGIYDVHH